MPKLTSDGSIPGAGSNNNEWQNLDLKELEAGEWRIIVNTQEEIEKLISDYRKLSSQSLAPNEAFEPNTVVIWSGLRKFGNI